MYTLTLTQHTHNERNCQGQILKTNPIILTVLTESVAVALRLGRLRNGLHPTCTFTFIPRLPPALQKMQFQLPHKWSVNVGVCTFTSILAATAISSISGSPIVARNRAVALAFFYSRFFLVPGRLGLCHTRGPAVYVSESHNKCYCRF